MPAIFPDFKEGDELGAATMRAIVAELDRWRNARAVPPLTISGQRGESPPVFSLFPQTQGVYFCQPSGTPSGATGSWPSITPTSFTADVYMASFGALVKVATGATIYNFYAASLSASKTCSLIDNRDGTYTVIAQSCT